MFQIQLCSVILIKGGLHPPSVSDNHPKTARKGTCGSGISTKTAGTEASAVRLEPSSADYAQMAMHFTWMTEHVQSASDNYGDLKVWIRRAEDQSECPPKRAFPMGKPCAGT